jgi:hypothetical protein
MSGEINKRLDQLKTLLSPQALARVAYQEFYRITPIAAKNGGNAKSNTDLKNNRIEADYPYAQRLDEGWSKQAPNGMTDPTIKYVKDYINKQGK